MSIGETLTQGSNNVFVNGIGVARTGDVASCSFQIVSKNQSVFSK
ncbi:PAAR domain-containing protein [Wolbachia endosymbiont (group A) of Andrena bucephala]